MLKKLTLVIILLVTTNQIILAEQRYQPLDYEMFNQHDAIMILIDAESGDLVEANQRAVNFYGYDKEDLLTMNIGQLNVLSRARVEEKMELAQEGEENYFRFTHRLASGEERQVNVYSSLVEAEEGQFLFSIIHDITQAVEREEYLNRLMIILFIIIIIVVLIQWRTILKKNKIEQKLIKSKAKLDQEIENGVRFHKEFFPKKLPQISGLSFEAYYQPAEKLGGDFYNFIKIDDFLLIYLVDVTGHGLEGVMLNIFLRECINNYLLFRYQKGSRLEPKNILEFIVKRYNKEDFPPDYFICIWIGVIDLKQNSCKFVNAGIQIPPLIIDQAGAINHLQSCGMPINAVVDKKSYQAIAETEIELNLGQSLFLTTDGLSEEVIDGKRYQKKRLVELLSKNHYLPLDLIKLKIKQDFKEFAGQDKGQDDITFLLIKNDLPIIDSFNVTIKSTFKQMYNIELDFIEFIKPYHNNINKLLIGFEEMVINAIEHGNQWDETKSVEIKVKVTKKYTKLSVKDQGLGFNWEDRLIANQLAIDLNNFSERGRGIKITNTAFDEIWYNKAGNQVNLLKYRRAKR